jgi:hypothetical protein
MLEKQLNFASLFLNTNIKKVWKNSKNGYWYFVVNKKIQSLHRAIALQHLPIKEGMNDVNHIDGNKDNNHLSNLEWCTRSQNIKHAYDTNLRKGVFLGMYGKNNPHSKPIVGINRTTKELIEFDGLQEAGRNGFQASKICLVLKNIRQHHKNYVWFYKT